MANVLEELKYSKTHEWVKVDGEIATIGITDHAQETLGEIVYLDLSEVGRLLAAEEKFGEIESVKAVSELYAPLSGEITEVNTNIGDHTEVINADPYHAGWLIRVHISKPDELAGLLSATDYVEFAEQDAH